jgi:ABC-type phosphate transport system auxiliary subunit
MCSQDDTLKKQEFEDIKKVIRICKSEDRHYNGQKKMDEKSLKMICGENNRLQYRYNVVSSECYSRKQKAMSRIFSDKNGR